MGEFTARIKITPAVSEFLKNHAISSRQKTFVKFEAENEQDIEEAIKAMGLL